MFIVFPYGSKNPFYSFPVISVIIAALNCLVYLYEIYLGSTGGIHAFIDQFASDPQHIKIYTFWTSTFIHIGIFHLIANLWMFLLVAVNLEDKMGKIKFLLFYLLSAPFSDLIYSLFTKSPSVGMSGCVFACIGAYFILFPWAEFKVFYMFFLFVRFASGTFNLPSIILFGVYILSQVSSGVIQYKYPRITSNVGYWAHIGGITFGILWAGIFYGFKALFVEEDGTEPKKKRRKKFGQGAETLTLSDGSEVDFSSPPGSEEEAAKRIELALFTKNAPILLKEYEKAISIFPNFILPPGVQYDVGVLFKKLGKLDFALRIFERLVHFYPDAPIVTKALFDAGEIAAGFRDKQDLAVKYLDDFLRREVPLKDSLEARRLLNQLKEKITFSEDQSESQFDLISEGEKKKSQEELLIPKMPTIEEKKIPSPSLKGFGSLKRVDEFEKVEIDSKKPDHLRPEIFRFAKLNPVDTPLPAQKESASDEQISEQFNLILKKDSPINLNVIKKVLSEFIKVDQNTVEKRVRRGKGLLLTNIFLDLAKNIKNAMASMGQDSVIVEHSSKTIFSQIYEVKSFIMSKQMFTLENNEGNLDIGWADIIFLSICGIQSDKKQAIAQKVFDIYSANTSNIHLRIWDDNFLNAKFSSIPAPLNLSFRIVLNEIINRSVNAQMSYILKNFLESKSPLPKTLSSIEEFDNFNQWQILTSFGKKIA